MYEILWSHGNWPTPIIISLGNHRHRTPDTGFWGTQTYRCHPKGILKAAPNASIMPSRLNLRPQGTLFGVITTLVVYSKGILGRHKGVGQFNRVETWPLLTPSSAQVHHFVNREHRKIPQREPEKRGSGIPDRLQGCHGRGVLFPPQAHLREPWSKQCGMQVVRWVDFQRFFRIFLMGLEFFMLDAFWWVYWYRFPTVTSPFPSSFWLLAPKAPTATLRAAQQLSIGRWGDPKRRTAGVGFVQRVCQSCYINH